MGARGWGLGRMNYRKWRAKDVGAGEAGEAGDWDTENAEDTAGAGRKMEARKLGRCWGNGKNMAGKKIRLKDWPN